MMAKRRWANATPTSRSSQTPASSGPRWVTASAMARAIEHASSEAAYLPSRKPAMPHIWDLWWTFRESDPPLSFIDPRSWVPATVPTRCARNARVFP